MDQIVSPTPGLVEQVTGILSTKKYKYATVFVDHFSRYSYMHLQQIGSSEVTLEGKHAFERMSTSHGIITNQYHADNVIFKENAWVQDCQGTSNPHLTTYVGLDAHHTNGLSERRIRDIKDNGRAMMLHVQQK